MVFGWNYWKGAKKQILTKKLSNQIKLKRYTDIWIWIRCDDKTIERGRESVNHINSRWTGKFA